MSLKQRRDDEYYMRRAISLARRGTGQTSPNPLVGCVIVKEDTIVAEGYHGSYGMPHAEVEALQRAGDGAKGATVYVNLEPCAHFGKTPPCAPQLARSKVSRVVIGMVDPNAVVNGKGVEILRSNQLITETGVLEDECKWVNRGFIRRVRDQRPWFTLKSASTIDGQIALPNGESQWITSEESRNKAHLLRAEHDGIMVGVGTVLRDDPSLTVRHTVGRSPIRIVVDTMLRTPADAAILRGDGAIILAGISAQKMGKHDQLSKAGAEIYYLPEKNNRVDLRSAAIILGERGLNSVLVEGGATLASAFIQEKLIDGLSLFIAPTIMGQGISLFKEIVVPSLDKLIRFRVLNMSRTGRDIWIEGVPECSPDL